MRVTVPPLSPSSLETSIKSPGHFYKGFNASSPFTGTLYFRGEEDHHIKLDKKIETKSSLDLAKAHQDHLVPAQTIEEVFVKAEKRKNLPTEK
ncbi:MAG: hypothetical protein K2X66_11325, partial [Cyanobacteria bacterium]|nr:hypothetical protein [Cyanobacteriota bacterium]